MVTRSLETQPFRSQRILKPSTPSRNQNFKQKNSELRRKHAGNTLNPWGTPGLSVFTTLRIPLQRQRKKFLPLEKRSYVIKELNNENAELPCKARGKCSSLQTLSNMSTLVKWPTFPQLRHVLGCPLYIIKAFHPLTVI